MAGWIARIAQTDALQDLAPDRGLVDAMERRQADAERRQAHQVRFYSPTFKRFQTTELRSAPASYWPAVSITGSHCRLQCDHCRARILEPMLAAPSPTALRRLVHELVRAGAAGMLLTGGSNRDNRVEYAPYYETLRDLRDLFPKFRIAAHTGLVDPADARALERCGLDVVMLDVIGAQETITQVYHLRRAVEDFEAALEALVATSLRVVPHVVIGLHYGRLLGEWRALEIIARHRPDAVVLIVVSPLYASSRRPFEAPSPHSVGRLFMDARDRLAEIPLLLGCMRPPGGSRTLIDCYALLAGFDGIAHPSDGVVELALRLGRDVRLSASCCSMLATESDPAIDDTNASVDLEQFLAALDAGGLSLPGPGIGGIPLVQGCFRT